MLQRSSESRLLQHGPKRQLMHRRRVLRPDWKIAGILRKPLLKRPHRSSVFIEKHRPAARRKTAFYLLFRPREHLFGNDGQQRPFHDFPQLRMMFVQQQYQPRGLRVERRGRMFQYKTYHLLNPGVRHRRLGRQCIVAAAMFENLFASLFHGRIFRIPTAKMAQFIRIFQGETLSLLS